MNSTSNGIRTRPVRRMTQAELDGFLEKAANILRGNVDHSEFRGYVFALLFYKRISDVYLEEVRILTKKLGDEELARDPKMHNFVVPDGCLWLDPADEAENDPAKKKSVSRKNANLLGTALNEAMLAIERANQPKFDGILTNKIDFNKQDELPRSKLVELINHFSTKNFDRAHVPDDLFGNAYEYLIRAFASKAGKSSGEFYTPKEVAYVMAQIVEPKPGHHVCDWASGSAGLLLQCRRYVDKHHKGRANELFLYAQESNVATYNISRINLILHGVSPSGWTPKREDSLRQPLHLDANKKLMQFDRIVMNPPFSLESWGYDDFVGGDPYDRFGFGMPPRDNGDYAWMQHVVKSLKPTGKAIVVMSQGILFRGQPEQTEAEDGRNQKADSEYVIREGFVKSDLIECVIVLPSKIFYGNSVPGCLVVLNKRKPEDRKNKILMIWASRDYESANPQNFLRTCDLMRILVPWRASGELPDHISLPAVGEDWRVEYREAKTRWAAVRRVSNDRLVVTGKIEDERECKRALKRWLSRRCHDSLVTWLRDVSQETGLPFGRATVKMQKTRWASCSRHQTVSLNLKLLFLQPALVRYVFIHELCHTVHMNHSRKYWRFLMGKEPNCMALDKQLRTAWRLVPAWM